MTEKYIPSPDEIQKEFEKFVQDKFGGHVQVMSIQQREAPDDWEDEPPQKDELAEEEEKFEFQFNFTPKQIKAHLDRYVVKQDEAKKALSIAICDHYNFVNQCLQNPELKKEHYFKQNTLLLGPTGVGKTYLIELVADLIGVPFVKADATRFTEAGYVGGNVEDLVRDLVTKARGDKEAAQFGIVYLDEVDKLANKNRQGGGRDISGRGVQIGLLKLMEDSDVDLTVPHDMLSQMQAVLEFQKSGKAKKKTINTGHILFIVSGAFSGLDEIVEKRLKKRQIGLTQAVDRKKLSLDQLLNQVGTQDLIDFGLEPEFVGRVPVRVSCEPLKEKDLFHILKTSEGSLLNQYKRAFKAYGVDVEFEDSGLKKMAELAAKEKTGARALMTVCEQIFRDFKFFLPETEITHFKVDDFLVENPDQSLQKLFSGPTQ